MEKKVVTNKRQITNDFKFMERFKVELKRKFVIIK